MPLPPSTASAGRAPRRGRTAHASPSSAPRGLPRDPLRQPRLDRQGGAALAKGTPTATLRAGRNCCSPSMQAEAAALAGAAPALLEEHEPLLALRLWLERLAEEGGRYGAAIPSSSTRSAGPSPRAGPRGGYGLTPRPRRCCSRLVAVGTGGPVSGEAEPGRSHPRERRSRMLTLLLDGLRAGTGPQDG